MSTTEQIYHQRILKVLVHIQGRLDQEHSLESLAGLSGFSPFHFHRIFRALVGESVMAHIRRLRLERAAGRLLGSEEPVIQVALEAGYETHEAFTRAFRAMFGLAPSGFRRRGGSARSDSPSGVHFQPEGGAIEYRPPGRGGSEMDVRIDQREPCTVAFVRHIGPYDQCGAAWGKLMAWAGPKGLLGPDMECFGLSHDDPKITPPEKLRYDACLVVKPGTAAQGEIGVQQVVGGEFAVLTHRGPYENFHQSYDQLYGQWLPRSGYRCRDAPPIEAYQNDPNRTPPEELVTEIYLPIEKAD